MLSEQEVELVVQAARPIKQTGNVYLAKDVVSALLETVIDYQMHTTAVRRAIQHFDAHLAAEVQTFDDLEDLLRKYPDDEVGNTELAMALWGYRLWTRAAQLRRLVEYFAAQGIRTLEGLRNWAERTSFEDFQGKVRGAGPAIYQWLVMRLGRQTVKPDVHILRFVSQAVGRTVTDREAIAALEEASARLGVPASRLDWSIWEHLRGPSA